jgi:MFS transporter, DHA1 family, multidrug resistance protein
MMAMTLAPALSPAVGAYLAEWVSWRAIFALLAALGAVVLALAATHLAETNRRPVRLDPIGMAGSYVTLLRSRQFRGFAVCSAATSASWFTFCGSAPFLLTTVMHREPTAYGLYILPAMGTYMLGNAIAARFAVRWGTMPLFILGLALSLACGGWMVLWCIAGATPWALFLPIAISSIGNGMSQPAAMAAGLATQPRIAGAASGLIGCLQMTVSGLGTFAVGLLPHGSALPMAVVVGIFMTAAMVLGLRAARPARVTRPAPSVARGGTA